MQSEPLRDPIATEQFQSKSELMKALVWRGSKDVKYEMVDKPTLKHSRDVILKVTATTICGSDLHLYANEVPGMESGDILGHEFMGRIVEKGDEVKDLELNDRVVVSFAIADGICSHCRRGEYTACETTNPSREMKEMYGHKLCGIFGYSHITGGYPGGQAEYVRVPFADVNCLRIPDEVPDDKALYLSDVLCTSYWANEMGSVGEGDIVGIWGLGPIGLLSAMWAVKRGARHVIGIDCVPERLELAERELGIETINFNKHDPVKTLAEKFPQGIDVGIDAAGFRFAQSYKHTFERMSGLETDTPEILTQVMMATKMFGRVSIVADYVGKANEFPIGMMMEKALTIRGGQCPVQRFWKEILKKLESGEVDPSFIVTHRMHLGDGPEAYHQMFNRTKGFIKAFIRP